ncbi:MAG: NnrU family protein [Pseudomonadota bacterium]
MTILLLGLALFLATHFFTGYARGAREALIAKLGANPYKRLYSLVALIGFVLIIVGWRHAEPIPVYTPPAWGVPAAYALMTVSLILFTAAYLPAGRIKSAVGHPMILGLILFSFAHLLANGDSRSLALFASFLVYGVADRVAYRLRGDRGGQGTSVTGDALSVGGGLLSAFVVVHFTHRYVAGVPLYPQHPFGS